jgi:hypothetical protein
MKKIIFFLLVLFSFEKLYSQSLDNSLNSASVLKKQSKENNLLISAKVGYHDEYEIKKPNGFNGGFIFGVSAEVGLTETFFAGFSFEFWHHKSDELTSYFGKYTTVYSANNFNINLTKRFNNKYFSFNLGAGIGKYYIKDSDGNSNGYINFKVIGGFDIRIYKMLWISSEVNYNAMMNMEYGAEFISFKIGPTIMLPIL